MFVRGLCRSPALSPCKAVEVEMAYVFAGFRVGYCRDPSADRHTGYYGHIERYSKFTLWEPGGLIGLLGELKIFVCVCHSKQHGLYNWYSFKDLPDIS